jgi:hypothetical protein
LGTSRPSDAATRGHPQGGIERAPVRVATSPRRAVTNRLDEQVAEQLVGVWDAGLRDSLDGVADDAGRGLPAKALRGTAEGRAPLVKREAHAAACGTYARADRLGSSRPPAPDLWVRNWFMQLAGTHEDAPEAVKSGETSCG